jgi:hypothetical protein
MPAAAGDRSRRLTLGVLPHACQRSHMPTLDDVRNRVRNDLGDTDSASYRWDDAALDHHIGRALTELSLAMPRQLTATVATTPGSRELSLAGLDGLIEVESVEFPAGCFPPVQIGFGSWGGSLLLHTDDTPDGSDAVLHYAARHTLDASGSSLTTEQADLVAMGAGAYAALEQAIAVADTLSTDAHVSERFASWGRARQTAFHQLLIHYGRRRRVRQRMHNRSA